MSAVIKVWEDRLKEIGVGSPQEAVANAVDYVSNPAIDRLKMLSVIDKDEQKQVEIMFLCGESLGWSWMVDCAKNRLALACSRKGGRAKLLAKIVGGNMGQLKEDGLSQKARDYVGGGE